MFSQVFICSQGWGVSVSVRGSPSRKVSIQVGLCPGGLCPGESLSRGRGLCPGAVSVQGRGLCPGGGFSVQGGGVSFQGEGSLSRGGGLCPGEGGLSRGVSVQGVSVQGGGSLSRGQRPPPLYSNEQVVRIQLECILVNKNVFQWDTYCPLVDCIPACTMVGVYLPGGGVPAQRGYLPRYSPPVNRMTDRQV